MPFAEPARADDASLSGAIERPHPDIELRVARGPLSYRACLPISGIDRETGLIIYLGGYGMDSRDGYTRSLLRHLANTYNCVAATLDYFGVRLLTPDIATELVPHPDFFKKLHEHYGVAVTVPKGTDGPDPRRRRRLVGKERHQPCPRGMPALQQFSRIQLDGFSPGARRTCSRSPAADDNALEQSANFCPGHVLRRLRRQYHGQARAENLSHDHRQFGFFLGGGRHAGVSPAGKGFTSTASACCPRACGTGRSSRATRIFSRPRGRRFAISIAASISSTTRHAFMP